MSLFVKRTRTVEAFRVTAENTKEIAEWISGGEFPVEYDERGVVVPITEHSNMIAHVGKWVVRKRNGLYKVIPNDIFHRNYRQVEAIDPGEVKQRQMSVGEGSLLPTKGE